MKRTTIDELDDMFLRYFQDAVDYLPIVHRQFEEMMDKASRMRLPKTARLILEEVRRITVNDEAAAPWDDITVLTVVKAGAGHFRQDTAADPAPWELLLDSQLYANTALTALSRDPEQALGHMVRWWQTRAPFQEQAVDHITEMLIRDMPASRSRELLIRYDKTWPTELKALVDASLLRHNHFRVFDRRTRRATA